MLDDATTGGSTPAPRCNWCSAPLPSDHEVTCPSCGATLLGDGDITSVPGLTAIDAEAILRNARAAKAKPRSRLLGWISGEYDDEGPATAAAPGSLAPPSADVRREILKLELDAQIANARAEEKAMAADAAVEEGRPIVSDAEIDADPHGNTDANSADAVVAEPGADAETATVAGVTPEPVPDADADADAAAPPDDAPPPAGDAPPA